MRRRTAFIWILTGLMALSLLAIHTAEAAEDPYLKAKAQAYFDYAQAYATTGLGGVSEQLFTDDTLATLERLRGTGDSTIWTGMYVAAQSLRYAATGEAQAKTEAARIARYLHTVKAITDTPGYVGRYAAPNQAFWRQEYPDTHDRLYFGTGDYAGLFWIGDTSRDQYTGWWLGMSMAHEFLGDEDLNAVIEADMRDVIDTLIDNDWKIVDNNGDVDGNGAARVGYPLRLAWLIMAWSATGEQDYLDLFHDIFAERKDKLWLDVFSWTNKYAEYFAFNLSHNTFLQLMRLTPDCETHAFLTELYEKKIYKHVKETHNAWYDSVYLVGCRIGGTCGNRQFQKVADDVYQTLTEFWDAPNQAFQVVQTADYELDPISVWWQDLEDQYPFLREVWNINPQAKEPFPFTQKCWSDMTWQRSPYQINCPYEEARRVGPGVDYMIAYWTAVHAGAVPGPGPLVEEMACN